MASLAGVTNF